MTGRASFSSCGTYRYELRREWAEDMPLACFVMLNPSTADASTDDPTIRKCIGFARRWGYGRIVVVNLFAFRATKPAVMRMAEDPVGPDNDEAIAQAALDADLVVCAWGQHGRFRGRDVAVMGYLPPRSHALRIAKNGAPYHPLYVPYSAMPIYFEVTA